jgi:hypothetical protein
MNSSNEVASVTLCRGLSLFERSATWKPVLHGAKWGEKRRRRDGGEKGVNERRSDVSEECSFSFIE